VAAPRRKGRCRCEELLVSYTVIGADGHLNFSTFPHDEDFGVSWSATSRTREEARAASTFGSPHGAQELPVSSPGCPGCASPRSSTRSGGSRTARSRRSRRALHHSHGRRDLPLAVQAHHGLVDGLHVHQYMNGSRISSTSRRGAGRRLTGRGASARGFPGGAPCEDRPDIANPRERDPGGAS
jgi:hypothetical protein